jgi:hypothetical protein
VIFGAVGLTLLGFLARAQVSPPRFREQLLDDGLADLWACAVADVNGDGKPDVLALNWNPASVVWYENPSWEKHVLVRDEPRELVSITPLQIRGQTAFVLGAGYHEPPDPKKGGGEIYLLRRPARDDEPWILRQIGQEPTLHRIHLLNRRDLVCSALHGATFVLRQPADPYREPWIREAVAPRLGACHNTLTLDGEKDGQEQFVTASAEGLLLHRKSKEGAWESSAFVRHPDCKGVSEVALVRLPEGRHGVATIEPHHGHQLVFYTPPAKPDQAWERQVLRVNRGGHTLLPVDLSGRGVDSLLVGFVGQYSNHPGGPIWYVYHPLDAQGSKWNSQTLDDTRLPGEDGAAADLDGDGRIDLVVAGGRRIKIYWNLGP